MMNHPLLVSTNVWGDVSINTVPFKTQHDRAVGMPGISDLFKATGFTILYSAYINVGVAVSEDWKMNQFLEF